MTTGEGGIVLTDRPEVADRARRFADHGRTDDGTHATVGHNFRMTNLAAAMAVPSSSACRRSSSGAERTPLG